MFEWLLRAWYWLVDRFRAAPTYYVQHVEDCPEVTARGVLYVIGHSHYVWEAAMRCPKGCSRTLSVNLLPQDHPCWKLEEHSDGTPTLSPSVWRKTGCGCHFFLRRGRIEWVA